MLHKLRDKTYLFGDIHGDPYAVENFIKEEKITFASIVLLGDIGIFNERAKYVFENLNKLAETTNNEIVIFRGNHDNPAFFDRTNPLHIEFFKNLNSIVVLSDYDEVRHLDKTGLIVCGGISVDRSARYEGETYWKNELPLPTSNIHENTHYDFVLAHGGICPPSIVFGAGIVAYYSCYDSTLLNDLKEEQAIYEDIIEKTLPARWYCGHYHLHEVFTHYHGDKGTLVNVLDCNHCVPLIH